MSMFSKLLISTFISFIFCSVVLAAHEERVFFPHEDRIEYSMTGFAYFRIFEDNLWHPDMQRLAMNLDVAYGDFKVSTQLSNDDKPVRRATLAWGQQVFDGLEFHATTGILPRLDSFFNNVTDNPGTSGMAILPFAGYNYRMQTGTWTLLEGDEIKLVGLLPNKALLSWRMSYGKMYMDDEKDINTYFFNKHIPTIDLKTPRKSHDWSLHYESEHIHIFKSFTHYYASTSPLATDPLTQYIAANTNTLSYELNKVGIKIFNNHAWIQGEIIDGITHAYSTKNKITYEMKAHDWYGVMGVYLNEYYSAYAGHSHGDAEVISVPQSKKRARDSFVGVTRETGKYAVSIEYHKGEGKPWMKYGAITDPKWRSWVMSGTYRF